MKNLLSQKVHLLNKFRSKLLHIDRVKALKVVFVYNWPHHGTAITFWEELTNVLLYLIFAIMISNDRQILEGSFQILSLINLDVLIVYQLQRKVTHGPHELGHILHKL